MNPYGDEEYEKFLEGAAENCSCCRQCRNIPCYGVRAGGMCHSVCDCGYEDEQDLYHGIETPEFD